MGEGILTLPLSHPHGEEGNHIPLTSGIGALGPLENLPTPSPRVSVLGSLQQGTAAGQPGGAPLSQHGRVGTSRVWSDPDPREGGREGLQGLQRPRGLGWGVPSRQGEPGGQKALRDQGGEGLGEGRGGDGGAGHRGLSRAALASERSLQPSVTPNPQSAPNSCGCPFTAQLPSRAWMLTSHRAPGRRLLPCHPPMPTWP